MLRSFLPSLRVPGLPTRFFVARLALSSAARPCSCRPWTLALFLACMSPFELLPVVHSVSCFPQEDGLARTSILALFSLPFAGERLSLVGGRQEGPFTNQFVVASTRRDSASLCCCCHLQREWFLACPRVAIAWLRICRLFRWHATCCMCRETRKKSVTLSLSFTATTCLPSPLVQRFRGIWYASCRHLFRRRLPFATCEVMDLLVSCCPFRPAWRPAKLCGVCHSFLASYSYARFFVQLSYKHKDKTCLVPLQARHIFLKSCTKRNCFKYLSRFSGMTRFLCHV